MEIKDLIIGLLFVCIGFIILARNKDFSEDFVTENTFYLKSCPRGTNSYYYKNGDMFCCEKNTDGNTCSSPPLCSMTSEGTKTDIYGFVPSCINVTKDYYQRESKKHCPPSMPNFYVSEPSLQFCTRSRLNQELNGPLDSSQKTCRIYTGMEESRNQSERNSCYNQKMLDTYPCFAKDCVKEISISPTTNIPTVMVSFTDPAGMRHVTYTRDSYQTQLKALEKRGTPMKDFDVHKNIMITEVSKAVFVDKTMDKKLAQF